MTAHDGQGTAHKQRRRTDQQEGQAEVQQRGLPGRLQDQRIEAVMEVQDAKVKQGGHGDPDFQPGINQQSGMYRLSGMCSCLSAGKVFDG